jgi:Prealbumin-like fold domain
MATSGRGMSARRVIAAVTVTAAAMVVTPSVASAGPGQPAQITIRKSTVGGDANFDFEVRNANGALVTGGTGSISTEGGVGQSEIVVSVPAGVYNVNELLNAAFDDLDPTCSNGDAASLLEVGSGQSVICEFRNTANVAVTKVVTSVATVPGTLGQFDVGYRMTATNNIDDNLGFDLLDRLAFPAGFTVVGTPTLSNPSGIDTPATGWTGTGDGLLVGTTDLQPGEVASVDAVVRLQVPPGATVADRDCADISEFGTGSLNVFAIQFGERGSALTFACAPLSTLTLVAQVINDNGGTLVPSAITLNALATTATAFTGTGTVTGAIGVDPLTISGQDVANYTRSAFICVGGTLSGAAVTVAPGTDAICTIVYNDLPPAATTTTTTVRATTTVASTLPPTGAGRGTTGTAGVAVALLGVGGVLLLVAGIRRRRVSP